MKLIICGGGWADKTVIPNKVFESIIDTTRPVLYIPTARDGGNDNYASCLTWIAGEFKDINHGEFVMVRSADEINKLTLTDYAAIFIGGGNTYKLLAELKSSGAFEKLKTFAENGGVVYGCSAGAIIFGAHIDSCAYMDPNDVGLHDVSGFDMAFGYAIGAHYTNKNPEKTEIATVALGVQSHTAPIVALPEEDSLYINGDTVTVIGSRPYYIFYRGARRKFEPNIEYTANEFKNLYKQLL